MTVKRIGVVGVGSFRVCALNMHGEFVKYVATNRWLERDPDNPKRFIWKHNDGYSFSWTDKNVGDLHRLANWADLRAMDWLLEQPGFKEEDIAKRLRSLYYEVEDE